MSTPNRHVSFVRVRNTTIQRWERELIQLKAMLSNPRTHPYTRGMPRSEARAFIMQELDDIIYDVERVKSYPF